MRVTMIGTGYVVSGACFADLGKDLKEDRIARLSEFPSFRLVRANLAHADLFHDYTPKIPGAEGLCQFVDWRRGWRGEENH